MSIVAKCRCSICKQLVEKWIEDQCFPCYNAAIEKPVRNACETFYAEEIGLRLEEQAKKHKFALNKLRRDRDFYCAYVLKYQSLWTVRMMVAIRYYIRWIGWLFYSIIGFIRLLAIGGVKGFRNLLPWPVKEDGLTLPPKVKRWQRWQDIKKHKTH